MCWPFHHHYKIIRQTEHTFYDEPDDAIPMYRVYLYVLQCERCGWVRFRRVKP